MAHPASFQGQAHNAHNMWVLTRRAPVHYVIDDTASTGIECQHNSKKQVYSAVDDMASASCPYLFVRQFSTHGGAQALPVRVRRRSGVQLFAIRRELLQLARRNV